MIKRTLRPNSNGTKKLVRKYGKNLIAVRYHYGEKITRKTVELVIEQWPNKSKRKKCK